MTTVTVYKVQLYDAASDETRISRRMATKEGAEIMGGWILPDTSITIDASQLESEGQWTARDFNPQAIAGFQTQVKA